MTRIASTIALITISILTFSSHANSAPGDLDPAFGLGGVIVQPDVLYGSYTQRVVIQPSGKIVFGASDNFIGLTALQRLNPDGSLDMTFGTGGILPLGESGLPPFAVLPNGKLLISAGVGIQLYNADGQLEGVLFQHLLGQVVSIRAQTDGKILISGLTGTPGVATFTRRLPAGGLDQSFGTNGTVTIAGESIGASMYELPDGSYVVKTYTGYPNYALHKLSPNGQLDMTFGINGRVLLPSHEHPEIAAQPDGKFLTYDIPYPDPRLRAVVRRYHANGTLDSSFANNGELSIDTPVYFSQLTTGDWLAAKPDGKIVLATRSNVGYRIMKLNSNGSPDVAFGIDGSVQIPGNGSIPTTINLVSGNRILVSGMGGGGHKFVRLLDSGAAPFDFDGDNRTDLGVVRFLDDYSYQWWIQSSRDDSTHAATFGGEYDSPAPADFTGDGKTDVAIFNHLEGTWYVIRSEDFSSYAVRFGSYNDRPVPHDFDGDGKADVAVFRNADGTWWVHRSTGGVTVSTFGGANDRAVPADYDGDGKADIAIFRPSDGTWWIDKTTGGVLAVHFGLSTDMPVPGDYTGDGKIDVAVWRPSTGNWHVLRSEDLSHYELHWGQQTDYPAPGDYDGDGRWDYAIFRPSTGTWYIDRTSGTPLITNFGLDGDRPIPHLYVPW